MVIFLIVGHWPKTLSHNSKGASLMCALCTCTMYGVLFSPLRLKIVTDLQAISVSS
jgi:hypothetical protein